MRAGETRFETIPCLYPESKNDFLWKQSEKKASMKTLYLKIAPIRINGILACRDGNAEAHECNNKSSAMRNCVGELSQQGWLDKFKDSLGLKITSESRVSITSF